MKHWKNVATLKECFAITCTIPSAISSDLRTNFSAWNCEQKGKTKCLLLFFIKKKCLLLLLCFPNPSFHELRRTKKLYTSWKESNIVEVKKKSCENKNKMVQCTLYVAQCKRYFFRTKSIFIPWFSTNPGSKNKQYEKINKLIYNVQYGDQRVLSYKPFKGGVMTQVMMIFVLSWEK